MSVEHPLTRRALLRLLGGSALSFGTGALALGAGGSLGCGPAPAPDALGVVLAELAAGRALGRAYRSAHPGEDSRAALLAALPDAAHPGSVAEISRALLEGIDADFAAGRVVVVEGWLLSRSEARLLALASLAGDDEAGEIGATPAPGERV